MSMVPFYAVFPDLAFSEMRAIFARGSGDIPDGEYGFVESYCDEAGCDCRRVIITIKSPPPVSQIWATINYGWESVEYYERWMGSNKYVKECRGAYLDPLNPQTEYANFFLGFVETALEDKAYVERLKRHYQLFKQSIETEGDREDTPKEKIQRKKRRLRLVKK